jgi:hypothetical protein
MVDTLIKRRITGACASVLLLAHAGLVAWGATRHSPNIDEVAHLPAGITYWYFGRFDFYRANPPLVRLLAALPVVLARPNTDWKNFNTHPGGEWTVGGDFIAANGEQSFWYFAMARWACIPLSLVGGYVCFRWSTELYGGWAGLLSLALWCFCPNVLACAQMITPDAGAAALGAAAGYLFWRWLGQPSWRRAVVAGGALGLAELTKTTWVILFLLWPVLWAVYRWPDRRRLPGRDWAGQAGQLGVLLVFGLYTVNLGYAFEGSFQRLGEFRFDSKALGGVERDPTSPGLEVQGNRFAGTWLGALPVPVPRNYLLGIDVLKHAFEEQKPSYLRGEWRRGGWWYYYLYALAIKVPLGTGLLLLLAAAFKLCRAGPPVRLRDELVLLAPAVLILVFVSSQTGFNHHLRYVLPALPFAFIWAGQAAQARVRGWAVPAVVAGALAWSVASSLWVYPHSLSYFNELVGGPANGHAHLVDSNIDWGQDLFYLKRWLDQHPEARPLGLAYFGNVPPSLAGIESERVPDWPASRGNEADAEGGRGQGPRPGWFAVSVHRLRGEGYGYFLGFRPVAMAGYSIYVYHLSLDDANRARRDLGLDELPGP